MRLDEPMDIGGEFFEGRERAAGEVFVQDVFARAADMIV